ncbi:MAG TPA: putative glycolipid-binding domain-containing protein [Ktedonobacterales bacterium]|nr:putative glycolipid-binding domain-containing protein [Ktedonobacterales bacterium]
MDAHFFWSTLREPGMEHLHLTGSASEVFATGVVLGVGSGGEAFHLTYELHTDGDWRVRTCAFALAGAAGRGLRLTSDAAGHWSDGAGAHLPALDGCEDIDITVTPFTNTLPIRRLALAPGESREILVAYVSVPELTVRPVRQRYTHLAQTDSGGTWRYEGLESGFRADLTVDADGVVLDYPGIWRRIG